MLEFMMSGREQPQGVVLTSEGHGVEIKNYVQKNMGDNTLV